jgi:cytochrome oxidase Cu insertion factor (SCO1/SenC/PrrC family)
VCLLVLGPLPAWADALPDLGPARNFALATQWGNRAWLAQLRPQVVVLTFFCVACDACPVWLPSLAERVRRGDPSSSRTVLVAVTRDPVRDTVPELRRFARARGQEGRGVLFMTGDPAEVAVVARWYGAAVEPAGPLVTRDCVAVLIDRDGRIRGRYGIGDLERLDGDLGRLLPLAR